MELIRFCISISLLNTVYCNINITDIILKHKITNKINNCIEKIIDNVKTTEPWNPIIDITAVSTNNSFELGFLHKITGVRLITRSFLWRKNSTPNLFYIIKTYDYHELLDNMKPLREEFFWNARAKFIIILENLNGHIYQVSHILQDYNVYNATVISASETDQDIYVFNSELDNCGKPLGKKLEFFTQCSLINNSFTLFNFRKVKVSELRGCKLKALNHNFWPFVSMNNTVRGISQYQLQLWSEYAGINIEVVNHDKDEDFGRVSEDYIATGMLNLLSKRKINLATGGYSVTYDRAKAFEYAYPYSIDYSRVIVVRSGYLSNWEAVFNQFSLYTTIFICLFIVFFTFAVVRFSVFEKYKKDVVRDILIVFGYFCSNTYDKNIPTKSSLRLILCNMLIFIFFLSFLVQAYLLSATTNPMRKYQIKHIDEALSKCEPFKSWTWQTSFKPNISVTLDCLKMIDCLPAMRKRKHEKLYTVLSEALFYSIYWRFLDADGEPEFFLVTEPALALMRTIYFRRGSTLIDSFNKMFHISMMSGLSNKNFNDIVYHEKLEHTQSRDQSPNAETLVDFEEIFIVLFVGYFVATIVFIFENRSRLRFFKREINPSR